MTPHTKSVQVKSGLGIISVFEINYMSIHGSSPGEAVSGKSTLAAEVT